MFGALKGHAAGATDSEDAHPLTDAEYLIRLNGLNIGAHVAVILAHGNLHALGAGDPSSAAAPSASDRTDHRGDRTAAPTADTTAGHAADHGACA